MICNSQGVLSLKQLDSDPLHQYLVKKSYFVDSFSDVFSTLDCKFTLLKRVGSIPFCPFLN